MADGPPDAQPRTRFRPAWRRTQLWGARALLVLALASIALAVATRPSWSAEGFDGDGFPRAAVPAVALVSGIVLGIGWPWFSGLAASTGSVRQEGDRLTATTVLGRRRILLSGVRTIRFRQLTNVGTVHGALLVDRRFRALVVLDPFGSGTPGPGERRTPRDGRSVRRVVLEHLLGFVVLLSTVAVVFTLVAALLVVFSGPVTGS